MKNIIVLGSTGSIGTNALRVLGNLRKEWNITGLAAGKNTVLLAEQARMLRPQWIYAAEPQGLRTDSLPQGTRILHNQEELCDACSAEDVDMVLCAIVGTSGFRPVLSAIEHGKDIALASKEILVMAGELVTEAVRRNHVRLLPVDSEHCAIFQCLDGHAPDSVEKILLTASGGPFHNMPELDFSTVTLEQTLRHPTWSMGRKITIDSASLMNKGLELIEAGWLFHLPENRIQVVIHPQSLVHSMVQFTDGSILAQMGVPDMGLPIHYCLTYPQRMPSLTPPLDFTQKQNLTFFPPDPRRFPALDLARNCMRTGKTCGAIFNAANEIAVSKFSRGEIHFDRIAAIVEKTLAKVAPIPADCLENILAADHEARAVAQQES